MVRLPIAGSDVGNWGELLNEFLRIEHNPDGTLRLSGTLNGKYAKPASGIPRLHLAADVQASLTKADLALTTVPVFTKQDVGLGNVTDEAQLPLTGGTLTGDLIVQSGSIQGATTLTTDLGTPVVYFRDVYARRHVFNATATFDGATPGVVVTSGRMMVNNPVDQSNTLDVATTLGITRALADTNGPALSMYKRGTTGDAAAAVRSGNNIFTLQGFGYTGAGYAHQATMVVNATQDWTTTNRGTSMSFLVTPNGSTARTTALTIGQNSQLTVNGDLSLADAKNIVVGVTAGTRIGTTGTQKIGFYGATPVVRPTGVSVTAASLHAALVSLGLITA